MSKTLNQKPSEESRSPHWQHVRKLHLKDHSKCEACGRVSDLQVHHCQPFHLFPELELDESNLITLCESGTRNCHFTFGHGYNWRGWNPHVFEDAQRFFKKVDQSNVLSQIHDRSKIGKTDSH